MMSKEIIHLDVAQANAHFSVKCFNSVWDLIDKSPRTPDEDEQMLLMAMTSLWHWMQRADRSNKHLSVGHWQVSRVYAMLGDGHNSRRHAERSLQFAAGSTAFFIGYAHEALARAALVLKEFTCTNAHLLQARTLAGSITDLADKRLLEADLESITSQMT